jgi:hypothetical protein
VAARPSLPRRLLLPSGLVLSLRSKAPSEGSPKPPGAGDPLFADAISVLGAMELLRDGKPVDPLTLCLADFHTLRAVLTRAGLLHEDVETIDCLNCEASIEVAPCAAFEWGPYVSLSLGDPELDATWSFDELAPLPDIALDGGGLAQRMRLAPRTVGQALPLFRALALPSLSIRGSLVRAMGILSLGPLENPRSIARALVACSDDAWQAVTDAYLAAHYPPRLFSWWRCEACGARNDVDAPMLREFHLGELPARDPSRAFPGEDAFARLANEMFVALEPDPAVQLVVDHGVPACDDGGEPLLGSYVPASPAPSLGPVLPATVTVYYRTFRAVSNTDASFDAEAELRETLEHELEHHRYALLGHDPMDEEEHEEIDREAARVVGQEELMRRSAVALGRDVAQFLRRTWWMWLIVVLLSAIVALRE